jgi:hypothetical protein
MDNKGSLDTIFDLASQSGIAHVMASIRASGLDSAVKNELRDLIFLYVSNGKDDSTRSDIEQRLKKYNVAPLPPKPVRNEVETEPEVGEGALGGFRRTPHFEIVAVSDKQISKPAPAPTVVNLPPITKAPLPPVEPPKEPVVASVPEKSTVMKADVPPQPVLEKVVETEKITQADSLQRIREIKSEINAKVGNPVNLINLNSEIGREYMTALLEAMKTLNTGASMKAPMERLERAFYQVKEVIASQKFEKKPVSEEVSNPKQRDLSTEIDARQPIVPIPTLVTSHQPVTTPKITVAVPQQNQAVDFVAEQPRWETEPSRIATPLVSVANIPAPQNLQQSTPRTVSVPVRTTEMVSEPRQETLAQPVALTNINPVAPVPDIAQVNVNNETISTQFGQTTPQQTEQVLAPVVNPTIPANNTLPTSINPEVRAVPLSESAIKPKTPNDLRVEETPKDDPAGLYANEVTLGLDQLLSEWQIFKKSGLFGTGPRGREHPLFMKLANLQIPLILAGRFEGSTQEIRQSVTDYMNGWRYEQGIIYEQGETFEHYLRRVIRHILDLQNSMKRS